MDPDLFPRTLKQAAENIEPLPPPAGAQEFCDERPPRHCTGAEIHPHRNGGVYVPGGTAAYPSTVLMDVIPAKVAGVSQDRHDHPRREGRQGEPGHSGRCRHRRA